MSDQPSIADRQEHLCEGMNLAVATNYIAFTGNDYLLEDNQNVPETPLFLPLINYCPFCGKELPQGRSS